MTIATGQQALAADFHSLAQLANWMSYRKTGRYHLPLPVDSLWSGATYAPVANRLYAIPFLTYKSITISKIGIYINTLSAGSAHLGIYNDSGILPSSLLSDCGTIDTGSTGWKEVTGLNLALSEKLYWLTILFSATPIPALQDPSQMFSIIGAAAGNSRGSVMYYVSQTYGALPSTFPGGATDVYPPPGTMYPPAIGVYIA